MIQLEFRMAIEEEGQEYFLSFAFINAVNEWRFI
jgi:hypothetical protein